MSDTEQPAAMDAAGLPLPSDAARVAVSAAAPAVAVAYAAPVPDEHALVNVNLLILRVLAAILSLFSLYMVTFGVLSWFGKAVDGGGANAFREDIKSSFTYILGVFSGIVQAKLLGRPLPNGNGAPKVAAP